MDQRSIGMAEEMQEHQELYDYIQKHGLPDKETFFGMIVEQNLAGDPEYYSEDDEEEEGEEPEEKKNPDETQEYETPMGEMPVPKKAGMGMGMGKKLRMQAMQSAMA